MGRAPTQKRQKEARHQLQAFLGMRIAPYLGKPKSPHGKRLADFRRVGQCSDFLGRQYLLCRATQSLHTCLSCSLSYRNRQRDCGSSGSSLLLACSSVGL